MAQKLKTLLPICQSIFAIFASVSNYFRPKLLIQRVTTWGSWSRRDYGSSALEIVSQPWTFCRENRVQCSLTTMSYR